MTKDYNAKLAEDYTEIKRKVERGMLPLVARNPAIDKATTEYAIAQAVYFGGKQNPPIAFRDAGALEKYADLVLYEELKWSHPDKMTIVAYPIMSDRQAEEREEKFTPKAELQYGDLRYLGKRKVSACNDDGTTVGHRRIIENKVAELTSVELSADMQNALENAGLTDRQRQAIDLVFFENMTQEEAAEVMGIGQPNVKAYINASLRKLREYMSIE